MIDVEQGALRPLEQDRLPAVELLVDQTGCVGDQLLDPVAVVDVLLGHGLQVEPGILGERAQR